VADRLRIIVVEDDASMRRAMARLLNAAGYESVEFGSAEALLRSEAAEAAGCVVSDLQLPAMSGFDLVDQLRRRHGRVPTVFVTAFDAPEVR
jgi:FixJ family two-component response regulator